MDIFRNLISEDNVPLIQFIGLLVTIAALLVALSTLIYGNFRASRALRESHRAIELANRRFVRRYSSDDLEPLRKTVISSSVQVPYVVRRPADLQEKEDEFLIGANVLLTGRPGLGKTEEALELIRKNSRHLGETLTVFHIVDAAIDVPLELEVGPALRNVVLFIDGIDTFFERSRIEPDRNFIDRLSSVVGELEKYCDNLILIFTARDTPGWYDLVQFNAQFWRENSVSRYQVRAIHQAARPEFIQVVAGLCDLKISDEDEAQIALLWDGTGEGIISALTRVRDKKETIQSASYTYPGEWYEEQYCNFIKDVPSRRCLFDSLIALKQIGIPAYRNLIADLTATMWMGLLGPLFRRRVDQAILDTESWLFELYGKIICPDAYLDAIGDRHLPTRALLGALWRALKTPGIGMQIYPYLHNLIRLAKSGDLDASRVGIFLESLCRLVPAPDSLALYAQILEVNDKKKEALELVKKINRGDDKIGREKDLVITARLAGALRETSFEESTLLSLTTLFPQSGHGWLVYGVFLSKAERREEAIVALSTSCELAPLDSKARLSLGIAYELNNQLDDAKDSGELSVELNPYSREAWESLGRIYEKRQEFDQAIRTLRRALDIEPTRVPLIASVAMNYFQLEEGSESGRQVLRDALRDFPNALELKRRLALNLSYVDDDKHKNESIELWNELEEETITADDWHYLSRAYGHAQRSVDAVAAARRGLVIEPDSLGLRRSLAINLSYVDDDKHKNESIERWEQLVEETDAADDFLGLSRAYGHAQRSVDAVAAARRGLVIEPDSLGLRRSLAINLSYVDDDKHKNESIERWEQLVEETDAADDFLGLSRAYGHAQRAVDAVAAARRGLVIEPESLGLRRSLAFSLSYVDDDEHKNESIERWEQLVEETDAADDFLGLSQALLHNGRLDESVKASLASFERDRTTDVLEVMSLQLGKMNRAQAGEFRRTLVSLATHSGDKVLQLVAENPSSEDNWRVAGWFYADIEDARRIFDLAIEVLEKNEELHPAVFFTAKELASSHPIYTLELLEAIVRCEETPEYLNLISWIYRESDELESAKNASQRSIELDSSHESSWYGLGRVYEAQNEISEALDAYTRAPHHWKARDRVRTILERDDPTSN